jgi:hypothetical protein
VQNHDWLALRFPVSTRHTCSLCVSVAFIRLKMCSPRGPEKKNYIILCFSRAHPPEIDRREHCFRENINSEIRHLINQIIDKTKDQDFQITMKLILNFLPIFLLCMAKASVDASTSPNSHRHLHEEVRLAKNHQESHTTDHARNVEMQESIYPGTRGIIERKLVDPVTMATLIGTTVQAATAIAALILGETEKNGDADGFQRGSLVASFTEQLFHEIYNYAPDAHRTIVVVLSNLEYELKNDEGGYIGSATIAGWGYSVFAVDNGWIRNDGGRGYENWCVIGYETQHDNLITF